MFIEKMLLFIRLTLFKINNLILSIHSVNIITIYNAHLTLTNTYVLN